MSTETMLILARVRIVRTPLGGRSPRGVVEPPSAHGPLVGPALDVLVGVPAASVVAAFPVDPIGADDLGDIGVRGVRDGVWVGSRLNGLRAGVAISLVQPSGLWR